MTLQWPGTSTGPAAARRPAPEPRTDAATEPSEAQLVADCRAGGRSALDRLVAGHYDRLHRLAYTMTGSLDDARDLTQETFLAAIKAIDRFRAESRLSTWLISILRNQYSMWLRGRRKWTHQPLEAATERPQPPAEEPAEPALRAILDRVKELPEEIRTTLVLFYIDGLKYAQIADAMGCPIGTVRSRLFDARERLKKLVGAGA